ncbi:carbon-nitrogen hydrolase family protein [Nocardiopsis ansamitocini]|uniref:Apolipoprotein acyltransferase n=1 Tax=Nocardiopsis ansamitocini TaxID=1670832 RepID=A0A9W6PB47_9ACTN|nr:carbon-nitrogen hydrolase family protein [Nocardiopsis ansamitocini]GLU50286.1 apolipoprotein acyltransferase [Nocardiopsis ansamitocini]
MRVALCQIASTDSPDANLGLVRAAVAEAAQAGARLVVLPEAAMAHFGADLAAAAEELDGPWASGVRAIAREHGVAVVAGMFAPAGDGRVRNLLLATGADVEEVYQKIHVFDAFGHRESDAVQPGEDVVTVDVDGLRVGLATCYDVRFPELFRRLADAGAEAIVVGASWGAGEGKREQWELLTRARALDCTSWVLACGQADPAASGEEVTGTAPRGIGYSAVIAPNGQPAAVLGAAPGVLVADIDTEAVESVRSAIPVLRNARLTR